MKKIKKFLEYFGEDGYGFRKNDHNDTGAYQDSKRTPEEREHFYRNHTPEDHKKAAAEHKSGAAFSTDAHRITTSNDTTNTKTQHEELSKWHQDQSKKKEIKTQNEDYASDRFFKDHTPEDHKKSADQCRTRISNNKANTDEEKEELEGDKKSLEYHEEQAIKKSTKNESRSYRSNSSPKRKLRR